MTNTDIGEYIVGAYLKVIKECNFVDYNVHFPGGGMKGLHELDVIGLDFKNNTAYLCEVKTWIKPQRLNVDNIRKKYDTQKWYAKECLPDFDKKVFMFWSPVISVGPITDALKTIRGLKLVINKDYTRCIDELIEKAHQLTYDTGNPFFRMLQILEHRK